MTDWARVAMLCVAGAVMAASLKGTKPEMALAVALATGAAAAGMMLPGIRETAEAVRSLSKGGGGESAKVMLKAAGVSLLSEYSAQLCRDAGESSLAGRAEMAGRVAVAALAVPMVGRLVEGIKGLLSLCSF